MKKLKEAKFKLTPQRQAILDYLEGNKEHPSAEDIYRHVSPQYPHMSFATVYNTLEALKARGMILELKLDPKRKRFDPDTHPHHHLICVKCKKIVDIPVGAQDIVPLPPDRYLEDFVLMGSYVEFYGVCGQCRKASRQ